MIFEGKTLAERTAVVDASEETLKAPSWSCNSWSSSVANLFPGLRAENQGGRSHCASTWSTLGTQVLIFSLLPLNLRAHHLLHLFRFGCRKEKGRGQGKPTSQKKKQGEEGQKGTSWAVCFCCPTSKRRTRWRWRWSWRSRGSWWGVSWVYTMAMFCFAYGPTPGNVGWHLYVHGNESTDSYVCGCHVSIWTWIEKKTVLDLLDAPDQHRSVPPRAMCCCKLCSPKVVVLKLQGWETSHERSNIWSVSFVEYESLWYSSKIVHRRHNTRF